MTPIEVRAFLEGKSTEDNMWPRRDNPLRAATARVLAAVNDAPVGERRTRNAHAEALGWRVVNRKEEETQ